MKNKIIRSITLVLTLIIVSICVGCSNAQFSRTWSTNGKDFEVDLYSSSGTLVKSYTTSGKVQSEDNSGGWYFVDKATGRIHIVDGGLIDMYPTN
jgi:hypothetical protein